MTEIAEHERTPLGERVANTQLGLQAGRQNVPDVKRFQGQQDLPTADFLLAEEHTPPRRNCFAVSVNLSAKEKRHQATMSIHMLTHAGKLVRGKSSCITDPQQKLLCLAQTELATQY